MNVDKSKIVVFAQNSSWFLLCLMIPLGFLSVAAASFLAGLEVLTFAVSQLIEYGWTAAVILVGVFHFIISVVYFADSGYFGWFAYAGTRYALQTERTSKRSSK